MVCISKWLSQGELLCARCGKPILKPYDCILHHKIELDDHNCNDASIALNVENVEPLHMRCHNIEHGKGFGFKGERLVYLVYGAPSAGKSTWVKNVANEQDLIVDVNAIFEALGTGRSNKLLPQVLRVRDVLIEDIERRRGNWQDAYVIGGYPIKAERERLIERLGAIPIYVYEPLNVLLQREKDRGRNKPNLITDWMELYERTGGEPYAREEK